MRRNNKLDFSQSYKKNNNKRFRSFIIAFAAFVVVLGSASVLMFMKSINFDLKNIVSDAQTTVEEETQTTLPEKVTLTGKRTILVSFENTNGDLSSAFAVLMSFDDGIMTVYSIPTDTSGSVNNIMAPLYEQYKKYGATGLRDAAAQATGLTFDRYICASEASLKSFLTKLDDITVEVPEALDGSASDGLILDAGAQSLPAEMFVKYLNYCKGQEKARTFASLLRAAFSDANSDRLQTLFSFIANNSKTDITIIDFSADKDMLEAFSKENGKVYVGKDVFNTDEVVYEEGD